MKFQTCGLQRNKRPKFGKGKFRPEFGKVKLHFGFSIGPPSKMDCCYMVDGLLIGRYDPEDSLTSLLKCSLQSLDCLPTVLKR